MIISSTVTNIIGKSEKEIEACVYEMENRVSARPCIQCDSNHDVIAQMFTLGGRFFFLPVCRMCQKKHIKDLKDFIRIYGRNSG